MLKENLQTRHTERGNDMIFLFLYVESRSAYNYNFTPFRLMPPPEEEN